MGIGRAHRTAVAEGRVDAGGRPVDSQRVLVLRARVARLHRRAADIRSDSIHKATSHLAAAGHGTIVAETLNVAGMMASGGARKKGLNRAVADAALGEIGRQVVYKTERAGTRLVHTGRWFPSSKMCSRCAAVKPKLPLSVREYRCDNCGLVLDRDCNAAANLARVGVDPSWETSGWVDVGGKQQAVPTRAASPGREADIRPTTRTPRPPAGDLAGSPVQGLMVATAPTPTRVENCEPLPVPLRALDPTGKGPVAVTAAPGFLTSPNKTEKAHAPEPGIFRAMRPSKLCGKPTVGGTPCRNRARSCTANHPTGAAGGPSTAPGAGLEERDNSWRFDRDLPEKWDSHYLWARRARAGETYSPPDTLTALAEDPDGGVRRNVAANPATPPGTLTALAADPEPAVRQEVAGNASAPPETLTGLVGRRRGVLAKLRGGDGSLTIVRQRVAANTSTPPETLAALAADPDKSVRECVAENTSTPPETLTGLAGADVGSFGFVRRQVAANPNTPPETLAELADNPVARQNVAGNTSTPPSVLAGLVADPDYVVRKAMAGNTSTPPSVLAGLVADPDYVVRKAMAGNTSTPPAALVRLAADPNPKVRAVAARNPRTPAAGKAAAGLLNG